MHMKILRKAIIIVLLISLAPVEMDAFVCANLQVTMSYAGSNILNGCNRPRRIPAYKDSKVFKERHPVKAADNAWNIANASSMYDFCEKMEIIGTPTIFINGYEMPDIYSVRDLRYIIS